MSEVEVTQFRIDYTLGATITVNGENWLKSSVSSSVSWNGIPSPDELSVTSQYLSQEVVDPFLDEMVKDSVSRVQPLTRKPTR